MRNDEQTEQEARAEQDRQSVRPANEESREGIEGTSLENAPDVGEQFDRASSEAGQSMEMKAGIGSEQVKGTGQSNDMKPPAEIGQEADRQAHTEEMSKDQERAEQARLAAIDESIAALEELKSGRGMSQERDRDQDRGYEMGR